MSPGRFGPVRSGSTKIAVAFLGAQGHDEVDRGRVDGRHRLRVLSGHVDPALGGEVCPLFLGAARRLHWPIDDPACSDPASSSDEPHRRFRRARDEIEARLDELIPAE